MVKKSTFFILFFILSGSIYSASAPTNTDIPPVDTKSLKNWFMKDFKIDTAKVTMADLIRIPAENWLQYHGDFGANHYSSLAEINDSNIKNLVMKWTYRISDGGNLRSSPIVHNGVMYVTVANEIHAIDASTGQWLWKWQAYNKRSSGINRGVAIYGDKLFFSTSDCQLVALNKETGNLIWSVKYAETSTRYFSTMAPLITKHGVVIGIGNHNEGERGFVASFSINDGKELWRFWTLPENSELRGAPTWLTGSYDLTSDTVFWAIGTLPDNQRMNPLFYTSNLYHNGIAALNAKDGKLKWFTRLGEYLPVDWDSNEPIVLSREGNRDIILQANRNGLFYKIDRNNGKIISSKPFVNRLDWKAEYPCPSVRGATNWMAPSLNRSTNLFYVMTLEGCANKDNQFFIKAINPHNLNIRWDYAVRGNNFGAPGILSTAGNIILSSEGSGHIVALNAQSGNKLWEFNTGRSIFAAPITYTVDGRQQISLVAGSEVYTFNLYTAR